MPGLAASSMNRSTGQVQARPGWVRSAHAFLTCWWDIPLTLVCQILADAA